MAQEVNARFDGASGGHIHCHGPNLCVTKLHKRLDLPTRCRAFRSAHIQAKCSALPDPGFADEPHTLLFRAVDMDDNNLLRGLGRCVAPLHHFTQCHRLVSSDEGVKDIGAPARAVLHQQFLRWVFSFHKAIEDAHTVCDGRAADFDDTGVQAKQHSTFQNSEADIVRYDDAAATLEHVLDSLLQQRRLSEASHQEQELNVAHLWLLKQLGWRRETEFQ